LASQRRFKRSKTRNQVIRSISRRKAAQVPGAFFAAPSKPAEGCDGLLSAAQLARASEGERPPKGTPGSTRAIKATQRSAATFTAASPSERPQSGWNSRLNNTSPWPSVRVQTPKGKANVATPRSPGRLSKVRRGRFYRYEALIGAPGHFSSFSWRCGFELGPNGVQGAEQRKPS